MEYLKEFLTKQMVDGIKDHQKRISPDFTISESKKSANKELTEKEKEILIIQNICNKNNLPTDIINHITEFYGYTTKHIKAVRIIQRAFKNSNTYKEFCFKDNSNILGPMFALFVLNNFKFEI